MASLDNRTNGGYRVIFRYGGKRFAQSLGTKNLQVATAAVARLEDNLHRVKLGTLTIPDGVDLVAFLLSDGKVTEKPKARKLLTLSEACDLYKAESSVGSIESGTQEMIEIHIRHLLRLLNGRTQIRAIDQTKIQEYINSRAKEPGRRGEKVSSVTIKKELGTLRTILKWAKTAGHVAKSLPEFILSYPKTRERSPFQTLAQIKRRIARGGLSESEIEDLWDCLFLDVSQLDGVLRDVQTFARHPFVHPMFCTAIFSGARRSELLRSEVDDICFDTNTIQIREKKRVRGRLTTRSVPMAKQLADTLKDWVKNHPGGKYTFCLNPPSHAELTPRQAVHHFKHTLKNSEWKVIHGWHCFRHSFTSLCAARGLDQRQINGFVGHQSEEMVRRYRHLFPDQQEAALAKVFACPRRFNATLEE